MLPGHVSQKKTCSPVHGKQPSAAATLCGRTFEWQDFIISACPKTGGSPFGFLGLAQESGDFLN